LENSSPPNEPPKIIPKGKATLNPLKLSIAANIVIIVVAILIGGSAYVINQSNTNPNFCAICHLMQSHVTSYETGPNLDHVHELAGVQCKDCHDYPLSAEISSAIDYVTGNYKTDSSGNLLKRKFSDDMCLKCHISTQHVADLTDFLARNPHASHFGALPCNTCHISHGQQIDYCATCHDDGGQRMVGAPIVPRPTNVYADNPIGGENNSAPPATPPGSNGQPAVTPTPPSPPSG
jgi:hypothetical protein